MHAVSQVRQIVHTPAHYAETCVWQWLAQDYKLEEPRSAVYAALASAGEQLGRALQLPGMMAASAAWDPAAVPVVCILAVASSGLLTTARDGKSEHPRFLLQPATVECLRYAYLMSANDRDCWFRCRRTAAANAMYHDANSRQQMLRATAGWLYRPVLCHMQLEPDKCLLQVCSQWRQRPHTCQSI